MFNWLRFVVLTVYFKHLIGFPYTSILIDDLSLLYVLNYHFTVAPYSQEQLVITRIPVSLGLYQLT